MTTLATTYRKNGYDFRQVRRTGDVAVYAQHDDSGAVMAYEAFIVQYSAERVIAGKTLPAGERTPSNEQWGQLGYTFKKLDDADRYEQILQSRIDRRTLAKRMSNAVI